MGSLYIHIPFCVRKCNYCGFYSTNYSDSGANRYVQTLVKEASSSRNRFVSHIETIYFGGGTPSVLSTDQLRNIITCIKTCFRIQDNAEFTLEANPNSLTLEHLAILKEQGANRISLGVQSFSDDVLAILGRLHTAKQAADAFRDIRKQGFTNINIDLMYGIPGQTVKEWINTLRTAVDFKPEHISAYCLSLDEGSMFKKKVESGELPMPDDDAIADQYEHAVNTLRLAGYNHYEISNFSRPGFGCRHNENYWNRGEYLGLGPGAWSFISGVRSRNIADLLEYHRRVEAGISAIDFEDRPTSEQAAQEMVLLSLRTAAGLDLQKLELEFGHEYRNRLLTAAEPMISSGLLEENDGRLRLSTNGFFLSNEVLTKLFL